MLADQPRSPLAVASLIEALCAQHTVVYLNHAQQQRMLSHLRDDAPYQHERLTAAFRKRGYVFLSVENINMILSAIETYRKVAGKMRDAAGLLDTPFGGGNPEEAQILNEERLRRRSTVLQLAGTFEGHADGLAETLHEGIVQTQTTMTTLQ